MRTLLLKTKWPLFSRGNIQNAVFFGLLLLIWFTAPALMQVEEGHMGYIDPAIWFLILLVIICFLGLLLLCWWILQQFWRCMDLPEIGTMVSQFKHLTLWQQLGFYFACFTLLLLAGVGCLAAIL